MDSSALAAAAHWRAEKSDCLAAVAAWLHCGNVHC